MKILPARLTAAVAVVCMLVLSCEAPRPRNASASNPSASAQSAGMLDPAGELPDLEQLELKVVWKQDLGQIAEGKAIREAYVADNIFVVETLDSSLFYLNALTGVWKSNTRMKSALSVPPAAAGDALYAITGRGLMVIDTKSGMIQKHMPPRVPISCKPVVFDDSLILAGGNGKLVRFELADGGHTWTRSASTYIGSPPAVADGIVFAGGYKGKVVAVLAEQGQELWTWRPKYPSCLTSGVEASDDRAYLGDNRGYVYCLTMMDGIVLWKYPAGGPVAETPRLAHGKLLVFTFRGSALCLDLAPEVEMAWKHPDADQLIATGKKNVYVLTRDNCIARIALDTGEEAWRLKLAKGCAVISEPSGSLFYLYKPSGQILALCEFD